MADVVNKCEEIGDGDAKVKKETKAEDSKVVKEEVGKAEEDVKKPKEEPGAAEAESAAIKTESPEKCADVDNLEANIIRQVEYYFGDANLRRDKFLLEQIGKDDEGWVPFSVLLTFKRLASFSTDTEVIANALMKSDEGLVEVSEDKQKIRRHPEKPIPQFNEEQRKEVASRTAYAKGFPIDTEMSDLIDYFAPFEKVVNIVMRKYLDKPSKTYKFKGSVFVTFAKKEQCEEFVKKEKVQYKANDLLRKLQEQYFEEKKREDRGSKKKSKQKEAKEEKFDLPKGAVLHFEGCDDNTKREDIRGVLEKLVSDINSDIAFIEYSKGGKTGYIRLTTENSAQGLLDKLEDKKIKLNDSVELVFRTLSEQEEEEFLKKAVEYMKSRRNNQNKKGGRKRKGDRGDEEPAVKQKA